MSRKTPKSKSATASPPKSKAKPKPSSSSSVVKVKATVKSKTSPAKVKTKRSSSNISLQDLAKRVAALESGNSAFQNDLKALVVEINLISEWIKGKFGIELVKKSSEIYKYINDSKNDVQELSKSLTAVKKAVNAKKAKVIPVGKKRKYQKSQKSVQVKQEQTTVNQEQEQEVQDQGDGNINQVHEANGEASPEPVASTSANSKATETEAVVIKKEKKPTEPTAPSPAHEQRSDNPEANNNEDKSVIEPNNTANAEDKSSSIEGTNQPSASNANAAPESPPPQPEPRPLTSFEKSRLALYQRTLQERRKSNAAAAAAKEKESAEQLPDRLSPPPPKITRIDTEPEASGDGSPDGTSDDNVDHGEEPPKLDHTDGSGHFLQIIPSPGIGRLQRRGRCVICSKKKIERKSRYWCGLCKKSLCQSPCYEEYHRSGAGSGGD